MSFQPLDYFDLFTDARRREYWEVVEPGFYPKVGLRCCIRGTTRDIETGWVGGSDHWLQCTIISIDPTESWMIVKIRDYPDCPWINPTLLQVDFTGVIPMGCNPSETNPNICKYFFP